MFLLVLGLFAGGIFGYVAGTGTGDQAIYTSDQGGAETSVRPPPPEEPRYEPEPLPESSRRSLRDLIDALPRLDPERGDGVIRGHVKRADGSPVAGAVIHATPWLRHRFRTLRGGPPPDDDMERIVKENLERVLHDRDARAVARSGADGSFTLAGLADSRHRMAAWREGFHITTNSYRAKPGDVVEFVAKPVVRVPLTVLTPEGLAPEMGANITAMMGNRRDSQWWTEEVGAIALEPGTWMLTAQAGDSNEMKSGEVEVVVEDGVSPEPVTLKLDSKPGIKGKVKFPPDEAQTYCEVRVLRILPGKEADPERLKREGRSPPVWSQSGGAFAFHDLAAGTWIVGLLPNGRAEVYASETVEVGKGMTAVEFEFPTLDPADCLTVEVRGPDGKAVTDVSLSTSYRGRSYGGGQTRVVRLENGDFRVAHPKVSEDRKTQDGTYTLTATSQRLGTKSVVYVPTANGRLTVIFDEPAKLEVTILDYVGSGYEGRISLSVRPVSKGGSSRSHFPGFNRGGRNALSAEGVQKFGPLVPGEYDVNMSINSGGRSTTGATERVVLRSGENKANVAIPSLYSLTVTVDGAADRSRLSLRSRSRGPGYRSHSARTKDGRAAFEGLQAGVYVLSGSGSLSGQMEVVVPGQSVVRYAPRPITAYRVSITDPEGGFARAGLRDGDVVVGIDGVEFKDQAQMSALLTLARTNKGSTLSVIRGRSSLTVTIDLSKTGTGGSKAGGRLDRSAR